MFPKMFLRPITWSAFIFSDNRISSIYFKQKEFIKQYRKLSYHWKGLKWILGWILAMTPNPITAEVKLQGTAAVFMLKKLPATSENLHHHSHQLQNHITLGKIQACIINRYFRPCCSPHIIQFWIKISYKCIWSENFGFLWNLSSKGVWEARCSFLDSLAQESIKGNWQPIVSSLYNSGYYIL